MKDKYKIHQFFVLSTAEVKNYRDIRERQAIAWITGNKSLASQLGSQLRELRNFNPNYREL